MVEMLFLRDWREWSAGDYAPFTRKQAAKLERRGIARRVRRWPVMDRMIRVAPMEK